MQDSGQISPCGYCMAAALPAIDRLRAVWTDCGRKNSTADGRGRNRVTKEFLGSCAQSTTALRLCQAADLPAAAGRAFSFSRSGRLFIAFRHGPLEQVDDFAVHRTAVVCGARLDLLAHPIREADDVLVGIRGCGFCCVAQGVLLMPLVECGARRFRPT